MGRSCFLVSLLLISAVLSLYVPQGSARLVKVMRTDQVDDAFTKPLGLAKQNSARWLFQEDAGKARKTMEFAAEILDYQEPEANKNPRSVAWSTAPDPRH